uniref:CSON005450 protein n=1 Tax=Culicoides sonorensis TaxID=179676 RepID=A0A336L7I4_CULSO
MSNKYFFLKVDGKTIKAQIWDTAEIYRIVSQKQIRDPPEGDVIRPTNVEPLDVKPTVSADSVRKQCCQ